MSDEETSATMQAFADKARSLRIRDRVARENGLDRTQITRELRAHVEQFYDYMVEHRDRLIEVERVAATARPAVEIDGHIGELAMELQELDREWEARNG